MNKPLKIRWNKLCDRLDIATDEQELHRLYRAYTEPQRAYHTLQHLAECLEHLDDYRLRHPSDNDEAFVEIALWYHDAIYQPLAQHNERNSAQWASDFLRRSGIKPMVCEQVYRLIMATCHQQAQPQNAGHQQQLLVDIDLAILGANRERFEEYEQQVCEEYKRVPRFIYRKKRRAVLQSFLALPRLYNTQWFYARFEQRARQNLASSIDSLSLSL